MKTTILILLLSWTCRPACGAETGAPSKAVLEASEEKGLRLSAAAERALGLAAKPVGRAPLELPLSAVIYSLDSTGVYRLRDGFYKLVAAKVEKRGKTARVASTELRPSDRVVVAGAALLRVAEIEAFNPGS